jgi:hypothetical protein
MARNTGTPTTVVGVRFTDAELLELDGICEDTGMTRGEFLKEATRSAIDFVKTGTRKVIVPRVDFDGPAPDASALSRNVRLGSGEKPAKRAPEAKIKKCDHSAGYRQGQKNMPRVCRDCGADEPKRSK